VKILEDIKVNGIRVDTEVFSRLAVEVAQKAKFNEDKVNEFAGWKVKINSRKDMDKFREQFNLPILAKTDKGVTKYDRNVLAEYAKTCIGAKYIYDARSANRELSAISNVSSVVTQKSLSNSRIYPQYRRSVTNRIFTADPNLIAMPQSCREAVIPEDGNILIVADWKSQELMVAASLSHQNDLVQDIMNGVDIFIPIAQQANSTRKEAKIAVYGLMYGQTYSGLALALGISVELATSIQQVFLSKYPNLAQFLIETKDNIQKTGYAETAIQKRRIPIAQFGFSNQHNVNRGLNFTIQGTASDFTDEVLNSDLNAELNKISGRVIVPVFDSMICEAPLGKLEEASAIITYFMQKIPTDLGFPMAVKIKAGANWAEAGGLQDTTIFKQPEEINPFMRAISM